MPPLRLERCVFGAEMPRPDDASIHVERNDLTVAEPGIDAFTVGDGSRRREVVLLVHARAIGPVTFVALHPSGRRPSDAAECLDHEPHRCSRPHSCRPRRPPIGASRFASSPSSRASCGCASPLGDAGPLPICDVTNTVSPHTIGDDVPRPARRAFHAMFSVALHVDREARTPATRRHSTGRATAASQTRRRAAGRTRTARGRGNEPTRSPGQYSGAECSPKTRPRIDQHAGAGLPATDARGCVRSAGQNRGGPGSDRGRLRPGTGVRGPQGRPQEVGKRWFWTEELFGRYHEGFRKLLKSAADRAE